MPRRRRPMVIPDHFRLIFLSAAAKGILTFATMEFLVAVQALAARHDHFLTAAQMINYHSSFGLPFIWHFGMWGDFFVVSPLCAVVVAHFSWQWRRIDVVLATAAALILSSAMVYSYSLSDIPQAHVQRHHTTLVGWLHLLYMAVALAVILLFYFRTTSPSRSIIILVTCALCVHLFVGTNMVLGIVKLAGGASWYPAQPLTSIPGWITFAIGSAVLFWRAQAISSRKDVLGLLPKNADHEGHH